MKKVNFGIDIGSSDSFELQVCVRDFNGEMIWKPYKFLNQNVAMFWHPDVESDDEEIDLYIDGKKTTIKKLDWLNGHYPSIEEDSDKSEYTWGWESPSYREECIHEYVNVSFNHVKMCCKHCGKSEQD